MKLRAVLHQSIVLGMVLLVAAGLHASTIYIYTGTNYSPTCGRGCSIYPFTTSMSVTGSFTTAAPLARNLNHQLFTPVAFSFSDGLDTLNNLNDPNPTFFVSTDGSGSISGWAIDLGGAERF